MSSTGAAATNEGQTDEQAGGTWHDPLAAEAPAPQPPRQLRAQQPAPQHDSDDEYNEDLTLDFPPHELTITDKFP